MKNRSITYVLALCALIHLVIHLHSCSVTKLRFSNRDKTQPFRNRAADANIVLQLMSSVAPMNRAALRLLPHNQAAKAQDQIRRFDSCMTRLISSKPQGTPLDWHEECSMGNHLSSNLQRDFLLWDASPEKKKKGRTFWKLYFIIILHDLNS